MLQESRILAIALPVHPTMRVQEAVDGVCLASINDTGGSGAGHKGWVTTGLSFEMWNVGCPRLIVAGSLRQTAVGLMTLRMVKGSMNRGASFWESPRSGMSFVESHTC